jgi:hypothetical protein
MTVSGELNRAIIDRAGLDGIRQLIRRFIADSGPVDLHAVWHPLGFIDIPLAGGTRSAMRQGQRATLHVWHPELTRPQSPQHVCHSHGWHLHSYVVHGSFLNEVYSVTPSSGATHMLYEVAYAAGVSRSTSTGQLVGVDLVDAKTMPPGSYYEIPSTTYHWTRHTGDELTVTAMGSTQLSGEPPRNVRAIPCEPEYKYARIDLGNGERRRLYNDLVDIL